MTQTEYEQKRRECWEEFKQKSLTGDEVQWPLATRLFYIFCTAFDRAYALGKEKDLISQDEIDKAAEDYVSFEKGGKCYPNYAVERACCKAFKDGANFALGKQEKDAEDTVINGWVARDKKTRQHASELHLFTHNKPERRMLVGDWFGRPAMLLDSNLFPGLIWSDDPIEVELIIKRKKYGQSNS